MTESSAGGERRHRAKSEQERTRHPTEVRRRLVIESARDLIADKGLFSVQIRDISQACGVSPGTITYHFQSLDEVLWEVVKAETLDFYLPLREVSRDAGSSQAELLALMRGMFSDDASTRRHWLIWFDFWGAAARDDTYGEWMHTHYSEWRAALTDIAQRGVDAGEFAGDDVEAFAFDFAALVDGLAVQCYSGRSPISVEDARRRLAQFIKDRLRPTGPGSRGLVHVEVEQLAEQVDD